MPASVRQGVVPEVGCTAENAAVQVLHLGLGEEAAHSLGEPGGRPGGGGVGWFGGGGGGGGGEYRMGGGGAGMASVGGAGKM